jgi:hypothetical protein
MNSIDPRKVEELVSEIHDSYEDTIKVFSTTHASDILEFCKIVSKCHKKLQLFNDGKTNSDRYRVVGRYVYMAIDNVYLSAKMLSLGYFAQSGNAMRQSLESVCMAILLSHRGKVKVSKIEK